MLDVRVLGSYGSKVPGHQTTCLLVNGRVAVDAGGLTGVLDIVEQQAIDHVLLSHAHLDHVCDLAFLLDNVIAVRQSPLRVWAPAPVLETLRQHLFNDRLWPDMTRVHYHDFPALELCPLPAGETVRVADLEVAWAPTEHTVCSAGYLLAKGGAAILFTGDTTSTGPIWALANRHPGLNAVFAEVSFPERLIDLARMTGHLTPGLLCAELAKLDDPAVPVKIFHMKPQYLEEIRGELQSLAGRCEILEGNERFRFDAAELS